MYWLIVSGPRFYDNWSELQGNVCLQKQVWHCCIWVIAVKYKKISFECILNTKVTAGRIRVGIYVAIALWLSPSFSV